MTKTKTTEQFIKDRKDGNSSEKIETGVWYSGFNRIYTESVSRKLPFVAVWSNGDVCALCTKLEKNFMTDTFKTWMKDSGCLFWFGYSGDENPEDKDGDGKKWAKNKKLSMYPFMRFHWSDGKNTVDCTESGSYWNDSRKGEEGAANVITKLEKLISEIPNTTSAKMKIRVNPEWSEEEVAEFREALKENGGYCPCEEDKTPDTKCMCKNFREQTTEGDCHCGLYNKYAE